MVKLFTTGTSTNVSGLREMVRHRFFTVAVDSLADDPQHVQMVWRYIVTPLPAAMEKAKRGEAWGFEDIMAIALAQSLPAGAVTPRVKLDRTLVKTLLDIAENRDTEKLALLNREMGLKQPVVSNMIAGATSRLHRMFGGFNLN